MEEFCKKIIQGIKNQDADIADSFITISDIIEKFYYGASDSEYESVNSKIFGQEEIDYLRDELINMITESNDLEIISSAVNVVGKIDSQKVNEILDATLEKALRTIIQNHNVLAQCIAALGKRDARIVSKGSFDSGDYAKNIGDALTYLKSKNREFRF